MKYRKLLNILATTTALSGISAATFPQVSLTQTMTPVSVELFLSVDVSGSVDATEYELQLNGYADAFEDPEVIKAIETLPDGLAVAIESWSSSIQKTSAWYLIKNEEDARDFASVIRDTLDATKGSGGTDVTKAIKSATNQILNNSYDGEALVIDISGDGISKNTSVGDPDSSNYANYSAQVLQYLDDNGLNDIPNLIDKDSFTYSRYANEFKSDNYRCGIGQDIKKVTVDGQKQFEVIWQVPIEHLYCPPLEKAVDNAAANNITINGLPIVGNPNTDSGIMWREAEVGDYYRNHVITDDGFVQVAAGFNDFSRAVKEKIKCEITGIACFVPD